MNNAGMKDNGDRRLGIDRREFLYTVYLPERRSNKDRRHVSDHRSSQNNESRCDIEYNTTLPV
jgi:hypothetical protein